MVVQIQPPQKENTLGKLGQVGSLALTAMGNPLAAGLVGGAAGLISGQQQPTQAIPLAETQGMQRRQQAMGEDPMLALTEARSAIQGLEQQYPEQTKALDQALMIGRRNQQLGRV